MSEIDKNNKKSKNLNNQLFDNDWRSNRKKFHSKFSEGISYNTKSIKNTVSKNEKPVSINHPKNSIKN